MKRKKKDLFANPLAKLFRDGPLLIRSDLKILRISWLKLFALTP